MPRLGPSRCVVVAGTIAAALTVVPAAGPHDLEEWREKMDPLVGEFHDSMPQYGMLPSISPEEVERWVELGREASKRSRAGDPDGAAAAYRAQLAIYQLNPDPYVALAMLEAGRGNDKAALELLRAALARGFTDLQRLERAEAAAHLRGNMALLKLEDAVPELRKVEDEFAAWDKFHYARSRELRQVLDSHLKLREQIALMAPVLGTRQTRLWNRLIDRSTAAELEVYIAQNKDAKDLDDALVRLMAIYATSPVLEWEVLPVATAQRLSTASSLILARGADHPLRPGGLACGALAQNANRDAKGVLRPASADWIRTTLGEVLKRYPDSDFAALAATGLVRTEAELGRMERASEVYRAFRSAHAGDEAMLAYTDEALGELALRAGGLPAFRATTLDGAEVTPESLRGKVSVLDFWAMSCRPCVDGFATLRRLETTYPDRVTIVGVSLDEVSQDTLRAWIADRKVPGRHIQEGRGWDSELVEKFGVKDIPFRVVVGPDGTVLAVNEHGKRLEKVVAAALPRN